MWIVLEYVDTDKWHIHTVMAQEKDALEYAAKCIAEGADMKVYPCHSVYFTPTDKYSWF